MWRRSFESYPPLDPTRVADYPALEADIATADEIVGEPFRRSDSVALLHQDRHRRHQVMLIIGAVVMSGLSTAQAAFPKAGAVGFVVFVLGALLASLGRASTELATFDAFRTERLKAERRRSAYFRYLSRTGRYASGDPTSTLRRAVAAIRRGEEPS